MQLNQNCMVTAYEMYKVEEVSPLCNGSFFIIIVVE